jgi:hypothetical protein
MSVDPFHFPYFRYSSRSVLRTLVIYTTIAASLYPGEELCAGEGLREHPSDKYADSRDIMNLPFHVLRAYGNCAFRSFGPDADDSPCYGEPEYAGAKERRMAHTTPLPPHYLERGSLRGETMDASQHSGHHLLYASDAKSCRSAFPGRGHSPFPFGFLRKWMSRDNRRAVHVSYRFPAFGRLSQLLILVRHDDHLMK